MYQYFCPEYNLIHTKDSHDKINAVHRPNECDDDRLVRCVGGFISLNAKHTKWGLCQIILEFVVHDRLHALVEVLYTRMVRVPGAAVRRLELQ